MSTISPVAHCISPRRHTRRGRAFQICAQRALKAALGARFDLELEIAGAAVDAGSISLPRTAGSWGTRSTAPG